MANRNHWTARENEVLLEQFILRKDAIYGPLSTKTTKKNAWQEIVAVITQECPQEKTRSLKETKKKWNNLVFESRRAITAYKDSIDAPIGSRPFKLKPLYKKVVEQLFGDEGDDRSLSGNSSTGCIVSEPTIHVFDIPHDSESNNSIEEDFSSGGTGGDHFLAIKANNAAQTTYENAQDVSITLVTKNHTKSSSDIVATESPIATNSDRQINDKTTDPLLTRHSGADESEKRVGAADSPEPARFSAKTNWKRTREEIISEEISSKKLMKERFELLKVVEEIRQRRGERLLTDDEIPEDMLLLLRNPKEAKL